MNYVFIYFSPYHEKLNRDNSQAVQELLNSPAVVKIVKILRGGVLIEVNNTHISEVRNRLEDFKTEKLIRDYHEIRYTKLPAFLQ